MASPYGLEVVESCTACKLRGGGYFCDLSPAGLQAVQRISYGTAYPKGAVLFVDGQAARGVFIVCKGQVKLSASASDGKTLILEIAESGRALGLASAISGRPYEGTAETQTPCQITFLRRDDVLRLMREHGDFSMQTAAHLSHSYNSACREIRALVLSHSAAGKLARLLMELAAKNGNGHPAARMKLGLTHEEIAQIIGTSRETVTRLFAELKKKQLIQVTGSTLVIRNRAGLEFLSRP